MRMDLPRKQSVNNSTKSCLIFAHHEAGILHSFSIVSEEEHMALVGVQRVLLAEAQTALERAALVVLVPDLDGLVHQTAELRRHCGGAGIEQLHARVDRAGHRGGRGGFLGDGQSGEAVSGAEGVVVLTGLHRELLKKNGRKVRCFFPTLRHLFILVLPGEG